MDVIVIGKKSFKESDSPVVIYCGQSRDEAHAAVQAAPADFVRFYFLNPLPYIPIRCPDRTTSSSITTETVAVTAPEPAPAPKKKSKS